MNQPPINTSPTTAARSGPGAIRVVIADDSSFMRTALRRMLESDPAFSVIGTAKNGQEAIDLCKQLRPDVLTLDVEMPVLDGLNALKRLKAEVTPFPAVLMCSSLTHAGSHEALLALRLGASDVIAKDSSTFSLTIDSIRDDLLAKIKAIASNRSSRLGLTKAQLAAQQAAQQRAFTLNPAEVKILVIGSSTGGPPVLETLVTALPRALHVPVVIAQHMPLLFTKSLAERLHKESQVPVIHGEHGMVVTPGNVYIAPGALHTRVKGSLSRLTLDIGPEPTTAIYKPSVNELYSSAAKLAGRGTLAVICTGMGDDGKIGAGEIKAAGGRIIAQDMPSCVVYGMPKAVAQAGYADASLPPDEIAQLLTKLRGAGSIAA